MNGKRATMEAPDLTLLLKLSIERVRAKKLAAAPNPDIQDEVRND